MDKEVQRGLSDRLYDKRKIAALELEATIRECLAENDHERIRAIIDQLVRDFAYAVHHPNARNGGLIGLAAAAIALGQNEVAQYLEDIIHPVLACFGDQDARVRYYACESMYNIAKVSKGEILVYFNEIFDALCKLATDSEPSVKNGADLLDRLIKDIVSEKASTYVSVIHKTPPKVPSIEEEAGDSTKPTIVREPEQEVTSFSLPKFIPLLMERIYAINPFARMFLVSWITLLDSIPDLELVSYLPSFLGGLISFLSDSSKDVRVATHAVLDGFLQEISRITEVKKQVAAHRERVKAKREEERRRKQEEEEEKKKKLQEQKKTEEQDVGDETPKPGGDSVADLKETPHQPESGEGGEESNTQKAPTDDEGTKPESSKINEEIKDGEEEGGEEDDDLDGMYIPGQDVHINFDKIIEILISHLDSSEEEIQLMVLTWIETLLDVSAVSIFPHGPRFLSVLLPTMANENKALRNAAEQVNRKMLNLIMALPEQQNEEEGEDEEDGGHEKIDYSAIVSSLTLHFLNEKEQTRVAALDWLIMLHRKVPRRILAINDGTFPALLKTLSDPSEQVITKDLQLLAQISYNSDDEYFTVFMINLLNLFSTDRRLLETRGNLIIRQLCISLNPERIYRTMAEILETNDDMEFASIMVQNLSNNLITAPELSDLRTRLRNLDNREGVAFFVALFKSWCHNSSAALALCLLAQAYEHAFLVLQILVEFEITVNLLIQIDKLVQLLESPVFTHLRLQLLEPEKYPYLYKCLYGILMLLPQSSAFNTLRNRLNSVSPIGLINNSNSMRATTPQPVSKRYLPNREDVKWGELLDKFRTVQRKHQEARNHALSRSFGDLRLYSDARYSNSSGRNSGISNYDSQNGNSTSKLTGAIASNKGRVAAAVKNNSNSGTGQSTPRQNSGTLKRLTSSKGPFGLRRFGEDKSKR
ncbi:vacuole morphology and inheritance protein 14 [Trichomonascus vanleenenianus]|uniref:Vac14p n=1 Tax=Trichomonascus vanleenenianus TaxID=2268995 RepID=UPI003ECB3323